jgi:hypothetical protein
MPKTKFKIQNPKRGLGLGSRVWDFGFRVLDPLLVSFWYVKKKCSRRPPRKDFRRPSEQGLTATRKGGRSRSPSGRG